MLKGRSHLGANTKTKNNSTKETKSSKSLLKTSAKKKLLKKKNLLQSQSTAPFSTQQQQQQQQQQQHKHSTSITDRAEEYLSDPSIAKRIPPNLKGPIKGSVLNHTPPPTSGQTLRNINLGLNQAGLNNNSADIYENFTIDKHGINSSLHIEENLYDTSKISLQSTIIKKPMQQLQPLINTLLPKDSPLDEYSYLRIRKMAKCNPDLLAMNESKLNSRLEQLSKIVLHPHFYNEYTQRYVFKKHQLPLQPPLNSILTNNMIKYTNKKIIDLNNGINNPDQNIETSIRNYKKLHKYPYHPMVLHVFEKFPLILRRKHIENTPELIQSIFTTIQSESGTELLYKDIGDYDDDIGYTPLNQKRIMSHGGGDNRDDSDDFSEDFNSNRINFNDNDFDNDTNSMHFDPRSNSMKHTTTTTTNTSKTSTISNRMKQNNNNHHKTEIDAYQILGRFPKLLEFDLTNRIHEKINSFTTIICAFLAQDDTNHNNLYTREDISNAQQLVLHFIISQPDILQSNIHNIIPKRLNFIQKACLFGSASETLEYISKHPRLISPTINPSNIQRLSLLRLKPPRFDHLDNEKIKSLGYEAQFAIDMVKKFANITPYPELSKTAVLSTALELGQKKKSKLNKKQSSSSQSSQSQFEDFASSFTTGRAGEFSSASEPISIHEHNTLEELYQDYDMCWGEYLESISMNTEKNELKKISKTLQPRNNIQPKSLEYKLELNDQIGEYKLGESSAKDARDASNYSQFDNDIGNTTSTTTPTTDDQNNNGLLHHHQLKLDLIPLLVLMHTKTFNSLFPEFSQAKRRGIQHRQQSLSSPTQYNKFLDQSSIVTPPPQQQQQQQQQEIDPNEINFNNFKDYSTESTTPTTNNQQLSQSQLRKKEKDAKLDAILLGGQQGGQQDTFIGEDEDYSDFDFVSKQLQQKQPITTKSQAASSAAAPLPIPQSSKDLRRIENFRHRKTSSGEPTELEKQIQRDQDITNQYNDLTSTSTSMAGEYDELPIYEELYEGGVMNPELQPQAVLISKAFRLNHGDSFLKDNLQPGNSERRYTNQGREEMVDDQVLGSRGTDIMAGGIGGFPADDDLVRESGTFNTTRVSKSITHLPPTRQSTDSSASLDSTSSRKFDLADEKIAGRDHAREKLHRYKGKGSQFHEIGESLNDTVLAGDDLGHFGTALNRKNNEILMDTALGRVGNTVDAQTGNIVQGIQRSTQHKYSAIDTVPKDEQEAFHAEQLRYIHKNKLQKQRIREQREAGIHQESDLAQELEFYSNDPESRQKIAEGLKEMEKGLKSTSKKGIHLGATAADIFVSSPTTPRLDKLARKTAGIESTVGLNNFKDEEDEFVLYGVDIDQLVDGELSATAAAVAVTSKPQAPNRAHQINAETIVEQREQLSQLDMAPSKAGKKKTRKAPRMTDYESKWAGGQNRSAPTM